MVGLGVDDEKIFVSGIPVGDKFSKKIDTNKVFEEFELDKDKKTTDESLVHLLFFIRSL